MRRVIRLGDKTTHGGTVVSAADNYVIMGKNVARMGDICTCPIPGHNNCTIAEGDPYWTIDGRAVALEGHKTSCGATLISSCSELSRTYEGHAGAVNGELIRTSPTEQYAEPAQENAEQFDFDEHFVLIDKRTGELLEDWDYRIHALGQTADGTTNRTGKTKRVGTDTPEETTFEYAYPSKIGV